MLWWQNIPFFSIILFLLCAALSSVLRHRAARNLTLGLLGLCLGFSAVLLIRVSLPEYTTFTFMMGHFPAPWGNEIRCGPLEALLAAVFSFIMLMALSGGDIRLEEHLGADRENLYYVVCDLVMAALLSQVYSNDLFTSYVFLEIMTLAACALIVSRTRGRTLVSAMRYMVLNLVGSGLFLLGLVLLYDQTGHLLMENLGDAVFSLYLTGLSRRPLVVCVALMSIGLCVKSALFPFHTWVPDAYAHGTPSSNAILSSLVSKGYIVLLMKLYCRVFGWDLILTSGIDRLLMVFALSGMIMGSLRAWRETHMNPMVAWSSVSQIGYIYLGISLGFGVGYTAAIFHLMVHAAAKSALFLTGDRLRVVSGHSSHFGDLRGAGRKAPLAGAAWTAAAFSMVGLPFTGGLISKILLEQETLRHSPLVAAAATAVLALSTLLNVMYFLRAVIQIWAPPREEERKALPRPGLPFALAALGLTAMTLGLFFFSAPLLNLISAGLALFI